MIEKHKFILSDLFGKILKYQKDVVGTDRITTSELGQGIYILQIFSSNHQLLHTQKIVK